MQRARSPNRFARQPARRRGIATLWAILVVPVILLLVVVVTDQANIWLTRTELKNALDAAALSGVQTWRGGANTGSLRDAARDDAREAFQANTALGMTLNTFNSTAFLNGGNAGNPNDNASCTHAVPGGIILLGSIENLPTTTSFTFDADVAPTAISANVRILGTDLFSTPDAFQVDLTGSTSVRINSVVIDISASDAGQQGFFDVRTPTSADATTGTNPTVTMGTAAVFTPSNPVNPDPPNTFRTLTIDYTAAGGLPAFTPSRFGIDADFVGSSDIVASTGADFAAAPEATVTVNLSDGQVLSGVFTLNGSDALFSARVGQDECAVQVQASVQINSISAAFLGETLGPFTITATSTAWFRSQDIPSTAKPELVPVKTFVCTP